MTYKTEAPCTVCYVSPCDLDHVWTRKAFPEFKDCAWNLMPLCRACHRERHDTSVNRMADKYPSYRIWLVENDWYFDKDIGFGGRWQHEK